MTPHQIALYSPLVKSANIGTSVMGPLSTIVGDAAKTPTPKPPKPDHPFKQLPSMNNHVNMRQSKGYAMPGVMDYGADYMKLHSVGGFPGAVSQIARWAMPPRSLANRPPFNPFGGFDMNNPINRFYAAGGRAGVQALQNRYAPQQAYGGGSSGLWQALPALLQMLG